MADWQRSLGDIIGVGKPDENKELLCTDPAGLCLGGGVLVSRPLCISARFDLFVSVTGTATVSRTEPTGLALGEE